MTLTAAHFDPFALGSASTLVLFASRVSGMMLVAPVFSGTVVPMQLRVALLVVLTVLLQPVALSAVTIAPHVTPATFLSETLVGMSIGLGAALLVGAAEVAGAVMAVQIGLSGSAILDPLDSSQSPVLAPFMRLFAVTLILTLNFHTVMLGALADSVTAFPVGARLSMVGGAQALLQLGGTMFSLGLRFAAPVIAAVFIANVALAVLGRAAPQLNILSVAFPVQIALGLFTLAAVMPSIGRFFSGWGSAYSDMLLVVARGFSLTPS
jgi:flagellar biosynthetic protein FliR